MNDQVQLLTDWEKAQSDRLLWGEFYLSDGLRSKLDCGPVHEADCGLGIDLLSLPVRGREGGDPYGRRTVCQNGLTTGVAPLQNADELYRYEWPGEKKILFPEELARDGGTKKKLLLLEGPMQLGSSLLPFEVWVTALVRDTDNLARALSACTEHLVRLVQNCPGTLAGVVLGDDVAGTGGPLYGPALLDRVYFPLLRQLVLALEPLPVVVHSDGDLRMLLPSYRDCGVAGIQSLERSAGMLPEELTEQYPDMLFWGGLSREGLTGERSLLDRELDVLMTLRRQGARVMAGSCTGILDGEMDSDCLRFVGQKLAGFMV